MNIKKEFSNERGSVGIGAILILVLLIMIIIPFVSQILERYRINIVRNDTTTAVELALHSTLVSLDMGEASAEVYDFNDAEFVSLFQSFLATNMSLNPDLTVTDKSLVNGDVTIDEIKYYGSANLPFTNPHTGEIFTRPYFNVQLKLIISPSLFRKLILDITGVNDFHYTFYDDISMPIDN